MTDGTTLHAMDYPQYQQYYPQSLHYQPYYPQYSPQYYGATGDVVASPYQQYYPQSAGYDPYNQTYHQYYPYQQQAVPPYHHVQGQYYPQVQFHAEVQTQVQLQAPPQIQTLRELFSTLDEKVDQLLLIVENFTARTVVVPLTTTPPPVAEKPEDQYDEVEEEETETPTATTTHDNKISAEGSEETTLLSMAASLISKGDVTSVKPSFTGRLALVYGEVKNSRLDHALPLPSVLQSPKTINGALNVDVKAVALAIPLAVHYAHQLFVQCPEQDLFRWNTMLRGSAQSSNPMRAISLHLGVWVRSWIKLFDQMSYQYIAIWNTMIKGCVNNGCVVIALGLFRKMQLMRVRHDNYSLASVLNECYFELLDYALLNKLRSAVGKKLEVDKNAKLQLKSNLHYIEQRINAQADKHETECEFKIGDWVLVIIVSNYSQMDRILKEERNYILSIIKSLIDGLVRAKRIDEAIEMFWKLFEDRIVPDLVLNTIMIRGLSEARRVNDALNLLRDMTARGLVPDTHCYNTLIKGFCDMGLLDQARSLQLEISQNDRLPDTCTYTILICGMYRSGLGGREARQIFNEMEKYGCSPSVMIFNALIDGLCKSDRVLDSASLQTMVEKLCESGLILEAYKLLMPLADSGVVPNIITYNILINGLCKAGKINGAMKLFEELQVKGHSPTGFNVLLIQTSLVGDEIQKVIKCQHLEQEFVAAKEKLVKSHEEKMLELKRHHWQEEVALEEELVAEFAKLMEKYSQQPSEEPRFHLILHKRHFDSSYCRKGRSQCSTMANEAVNLFDIFKGLAALKTKATSLNLLHDDAKVFEAYPDLNLEDKVLSKGEGNVMNREGLEQFDSKKVVVQMKPNSMVDQPGPAIRQSTRARVTPHLRD